MTTDETLAAGEPSKTSASHDVISGAVRHFATFSASSFSSFVENKLSSSKFKSRIGARFATVKNELCIILSVSRNAAMSTQNSSIVMTQVDERRRKASHRGRGIAA